MAVYVDDVANTYTGDGATTAYPITFPFQDNTQIKVKIVDTAHGTESILAEGVDYSLTGGNPATGVSMVSAPSSSVQLVIYRDTAKLQTASYVESGPFPAKTHEGVLDRMVMMIQELANKINTIAPVASGGVTELTPQTVSDGGTLTVGSSNSLLVKKVKGATANAAVAVIQDGSTDWQELKLVGDDDDMTLVIDSLVNLKTNGSMTMTKRSVLTLSWDQDNNYWIETARRN